MSQSPSSDACILLLINLQDLLHIAITSHMTHVLIHTQDLLYVAITSDQERIDANGDLGKL